MSDVLADTFIGAYRLVGRAAVPFLPIALSWRARHGKEDRARLGERFGRAGLPRPAGRLAWVHAASVGETNAIIPLLEKLTASGFFVVLTTVTVTSAGVAAKRLPSGACHQFAPLDAPPLVGRFLDHWRPELALFVESELWPTTIGRLSAAGIPQILVNARLSERSFRGWRRFGGVARSVFGRIPLCLAQSRLDAQRFEALGAPRVVVTGNLKFDAPPPAVDAGILEEFKLMTADRPVWVAASTHAGEETVVAAAHGELRSRFGRILTIIVPRHPARGDTIRAELDAVGLRTAQRSRGEPIDETTDIYLADSVGELGLFYRVAPIAFLGGSLVPHGGQNPIEPARLGCAVLHGGHVHNFAEIYATIDALGGAAPVANAGDLAAVVARFLEAPEAAKHFANNTAVALEPFGGALAATMAEIDPYLTKGAGS